MTQNLSKLSAVSEQLFEEAKTRDEMESLPSYEKFMSVLNSNRPQREDIKELDPEVKFILFYFLDNALFEMEEVVEAFQKAMKLLPCEWFGTPDYLETPYSQKFIAFVRNYVKNKMLVPEIDNNFELNCIEGETNALSFDAQWKADDYFMAYYLGSKNIEFDFNLPKEQREKSYRKILEDK